MGMSDKEFAVFSTKMYLELKKIKKHLDKLPSDNDTSEIKEMIDDQMTTYKVSMDGFVPDSKI